MARRKKEENMTYEERLAWIDEQIAAHKEAVSDLKKKRKALEAEQQEAAMEEIMTFIQQSGKTPTEFLQQLKTEQE